MVLFALTFQPSGINVLDTFEAIKGLDKVDPEMKKLGAGAIPYDGGLYPVSVCTVQYHASTHFCHNHFYLSTALTSCI
jgi:hypothetical protein